MVSISEKYIYSLHCLTYSDLLREKKFRILCLLLTSHSPSQQIASLIVCIRQTVYEISQGKMQLFHKVVLNLLLKLAVDYWASLSNARLPHLCSLIFNSCSSQLYYVISFLRIPPHDEHPCLDSHFRSPRRAADFHRLELHHAWRTLFADPAKGLDPRYDHLSHFELECTI